MRALLAAVLIGIPILTSPHTVPGTGIDPSWSAVLSYAHEKHLQFGRDIVYTFGPTGFLTTLWFLPYAHGLRMMTDVLLCFGLAAGVCLLAWRLELAPGLLLMGSFSFLSTSYLPGADLFIPMGLLCWGLLCVPGRGGLSTAAAVVLTGLAVFAAMGKGTSLFVAVPTVALLALDQARRGRRRVARAMAGVFAAGTTFCWLLFGQALAGIPAFLHGLWLMSRDYGGTMQATDPRCGPTILMQAAIASALAGGLIGCRCRLGLGRAKAGTSTPRWLAAAWLFGMLFVLWKSGMTRASLYHVNLLLAFVVLLALALEALPLPPGRGRRWIWGFTLLCCLVSSTTLEQGAGAALGAALRLSPLTRPLAFVVDADRRGAVVGGAGERVPLQAAGGAFGGVAGGRGHE